jgi:ubiquinone biosynthesis protein
MTHAANAIEDLVAQQPEAGNARRNILHAAAIGARTALFLGRSVLVYMAGAISGDRAEAHRRFGHLLSHHLERLGPTFVKAGQVISTRTDLLPGEILRGLQRLQQHATPVEFSVIEATLKTAYGDRIAAIFRAIDPTAIGCGAIAQVHRAVTVDGREVALKILKPGVRERLAADARLAAAIARLISKLPMARNVPVMDAVRETSGILSAQTDFLREAAGMRRLLTNFRYVDGIRFPAVIDELCGDSVIAMEYLSDLSRLDDCSADPDERRRVALIGLRALYRMIFDHGFVHADMHSGNVFRASDGCVIVLDAGLAAEVDEMTRREFVGFFFAFVNNDGPECAEITWRTASARPSEDRRPAFEASMTAFIAAESAKKSGEFEVVGFVGRLLDIQRQHGLRATPAFISMVFAMAVYDGVCRSLYPGCDFQGEARGYLIAARYRRFARPSALPN